MSSYYISSHWSTHRQTDIQNVNATKMPSSCCVTIGKFVDLRHSNEKKMDVKIDEVCEWVKIETKNRVKSEL